MYRFSKLFYRILPIPEELALEEIFDDVVGNLMLCHQRATESEAFRIIRRN